MEQLLKPKEYADTKEEGKWRDVELGKMDGEQTRVEYLKQLLFDHGVRLGDTDHAKVTLLVNLTLNDRHKDTQTKEMKRLTHLCNKFGPGSFTCLGQFAYDVQEVE